MSPEIPETVVPLTPVVPPMPESVPPMPMVPEVVPPSSLLLEEREEYEEE